MRPTRVLGDFNAMHISQMAFKLVNPGINSCTMQTPMFPREMSTNVVPPVAHSFPT